MRTPNTFEFLMKLWLLTTVVPLLSQSREGLHYLPIPDFISFWICCDNPWVYYKPKPLNGLTHWLNLRPPHPLKWAKNMKKSFSVVLWKFLLHCAPRWLLFERSNIVIFVFFVPLIGCGGHKFDHGVKPLDFSTLMGYYQISKWHQNRLLASSEAFLRTYVGSCWWINYVYNYTLH